MGLVERDYVILKVDGERDIQGGDVAQRVTRGTNHGIPFHAIFDAEGQMLVDSAGPLGNIGYPSGYEGQKQLRKMLLFTRSRLTGPEIEELVMSVE